jgi:mRNA-degrading endonuclease RelE of RelBE toxin-antitoxin system
MSYKDEYHPKTRADLKKLDKPVLRELFDTHINTILTR